MQSFIFKFAIFCLAFIQGTQVSGSFPSFGVYRCLHEIIRQFPKDVSRHVGLHSLLGFFPSDPSQLGEEFQAHKQFLASFVFENSTTRLSSAKEILQSQKTQFTDGPRILYGKTHRPTIILTPSNKGSELNRFAKSMHSQFEASVAYAGDSSGWFDPETNTIYVSMLEILSGKPGPIAFHEARHALFYYLFRNERDSLFLGEVSPVDPNKPLWSSSYSGSSESQTEPGVSLEELATQPLSVELWTRHLVEQSETGSANPTDLLTIRMEAIGKAENTRDMATEMLRIVIVTLERLKNKPTDIELKYREAKTSTGDKLAIQMGSVKVGNAQFIMRIIGENEAKRWFTKLVQEKSEAAVAQIWEAELRRLMGERLLALEPILKLLRDRSANYISQAEDNAAPFALLDAAEQLSMVATLHLERESPVPAPQAKKKENWFKWFFGN